MKRRITLTSRNLRPRAGILPVEYPKRTAPISFKKTRKVVSFKGERVSVEAAKKVLHYLNNVDDVMALAKFPSLGKVVGQRILDRKKDFQKFTSLEQLKNIAGFGRLKFRDIVNSSS